MKFKPGDKIEHVLGDFKITLISISKEGHYYYMFDDSGEYGTDDGNYLEERFVLSVKGMRDKKLKELLDE